MIEKRRTTSGQASYFHCHEESVTVAPEKTCDKFNLLVTISNISTTTTIVPEALNSSSNPNTPLIALSIDLDTPTPSSLHPSLLSSDSEKKKILKIKAQVA